MKRFIVLSLDSTDKFKGDPDYHLLSVDLDTHDLRKAELAYENIRRTLSNVYLVEVRKQSEHI